MISNKTDCKFTYRKFPIILDIGSGSGNLTCHMAQLIPHETIIGIDIDPAMIAFSINNKPTLETISYVCQDLSQPWDQLSPELARLAGHVDLIMSNMTLNWVIDIGTMFKVLV